MKRIISMLLVFAGAINMFSASLVFAADADYQYVTKVEVADDNYLYINVLGNFNAALHGCGNGAFVRSKYPVTDERTKAMMSIAIASFLGRKGVHVWTNGCVNGDANGYAVMQTLQVFQ